jgi:hypothetical protein
MHKKCPAFYLYVISSICYLIAALFKSEMFMLVTKPIIIPSIAFYYFMSFRKFSWSYVFVMFFFFIGEIFFLLNLNELYIEVLLIFLIPYVFVNYNLVQKVRRIPFKHIQRNFDFTTIFILVFLLILLYRILEIIETTNPIEYYIYVAFGLNLLLMGYLTAVIQNYNANKENWYLVAAVVTFILSDLFFILYFNIQKLLVFDLIYQSSQLISYFFFTKYFAVKKKSF